MYKMGEGSVQIREEERSGERVYIELSFPESNLIKLVTHFSLQSQNLTLLVLPSCVSFMATIK